MHAHGHGHAHGHSHGATEGWRYGVSIGLNLLVVAAQLGVGFAISSTALIADAGHNASDVLGLIMAGIAAWLMRRAPSDRRTYGFGKAGVIAALLNSLLLVAACAVLAWEAIDRLIHPPAAAPPAMLMIVTAALGVLVNLGSGLLLMGGHPGDVNRKAAVIHLFGDAAVSVGVVASALLIWWTGARWIDPVTGLLIVGVILATTWSLLVQSLDLALDAAPRDIDVAAVRGWLAGLSGVAAVHDLHVWPMSSTETALTAHLVLADGQDGGNDLLHAVTEGLAQKFGIGHATVQVERAGLNACMHGDGVLHP